MKWTAPIAALGLIVSASFPAVAQEGTMIPSRAAATGPERELFPFLQSLDYDAASRGPLLVITRPRSFKSLVALPAVRPPLATLAQAAGRRLVREGSITALVPLTMTVINTNPGKANPFAGLAPGETLKLLLGTLSPAQWRLIGSEGGLGFGDLSDNQKPLWDQIIPPAMRVRKNQAQVQMLNIQGKQVEQVVHIPLSETNVTDTSAVRLQINKSVGWEIPIAGSGGNRYVGYANDEEPRTGYIVWDIQRIDHELSHGEVSGGSELFSLGVKKTDGKTFYGRSLLIEQPNRLKPTIVDYASRSLDRSVSFAFDPRPLPPVPEGKPTPPPDAALPTVGDLLARVSQASGFAFVADRRVRDLPVFLKGDSARAGDVLQALAHSVCGAFRNVSGENETPLYLLTDDLEGIGTRAGRLSEWAAEAEFIKTSALNRVENDAAKAKPLPYLSFRADDKLALTDAQTHAAEELYRKGSFAPPPPAPLDTLNPEWQAMIRHFVDRLGQSNNPPTLDTSKISLNEEMSVSLVIPGLGSVPCRDLAGSIRDRFLRNVALTLEEKSAIYSSAAKPAKTAESAAGFPQEIKRRIVLVNVASGEDAKQLVASTAHHGFTDLWLEVPLTDTTNSARSVRDAVDAARASGLAVGASARLFQNSLPGAQEQTILGETGTQFYERKKAQLAKDDPRASYFDRSLRPYVGWTTPDEDIAFRSLKTLLSVSGITALTLRGTTPPGWARMPVYSDRLEVDGANGYTLPLRRAFLRTCGIDPIDIPERLGTLTLDWDLGYFMETDGKGEMHAAGDLWVRRPADEVPRFAWREFRHEANNATLARLYEDLQRESPRLPLFIGDRTSDAGGANYGWIGSWDRDDHLPDNPGYVDEKGALSAARQASQTAFVRFSFYQASETAAKPEAAALFAQRITALGRTMRATWDGVVIDMIGMTTADVCRLLGGLPETTPTKP